MKTFTASKDRPITPLDISRILMEFQTGDLNVLSKRYKYYTGQHAIMNRTASDEGKPCNRIVTNFVKSIVDTYEGYAVGIPVAYDSDSAHIDELHDVFDYNDITEADAALFRDALIFGRAVEICYVDEDSKPRFCNLDPRSCIPVIDNTLTGDLLYGIRFWQEDLVEGDLSEYWVEVYDSTFKTLYRSNSGFSSVTEVSREPHMFTQVPMTFFDLNREAEGVAVPIFSLQDAYNSLISDSIDDWDSFCDAYMVIKGMNAEEDDIADMKKHRVLLMDSDASAEYLVKNTQTTEIEHLLTTVESKIREMSACPNFAAETFGTSSGIAIRYRLMQMENKTSGMLNAFRKALQRRIELLSDIVALLDGESFWRDIQITFTRNLPIDLTSMAAELNSLRGLVSDRTLLQQLPFIDDVEEEMARIDEEAQKNMELYSFGRTVDAQEDETETVDGKTAVLE